MTPGRWGGCAGLTLVAADNTHPLAGGLHKALSRAGVHVSRCEDGAEALLTIGQQDPDVILLGPDLPVVPTPTVVTVVRRTSSAVVLIGAGTAETELAGAALMAGATTLIRRPYDAAELLHAISATRALNGRHRSHEPLLRYGPLELDSQSFCVRLHGREISLPLKEFELLRLLMVHADHVVTANQIRQELWGPDGVSPSSNAVTVHVARLRARLGGPQVLRTVRGLGYRLTYSGSET